jgi:hypothetical protein
MTEEEMKDPFTDDSAWTVRGTCGMPYVGENRYLRDTVCVHYAGHRGPHKSPEGRWWATPGQA